MTNGNDFAFNDTATNLRQAGEDGVKADNPPLTKREYFAAMALQGYMIGPNYASCAKGEDVAKAAVWMADQLIKTLNTEKP